MINCKPLRSLALLFCFLEIAWLNAAVAIPTLISQPDQIIAESDTIVQGSFILNAGLSGRKDSFVDPFNGTIDCMSYTLPFKIDGTLKGNTGETINVKLFYPTNRQISVSCLLPLQEKILLFLKKNPNDGTFSLVDPWGSWMVVTGSKPTASISTNPNKAILEDITGFLSFYLSHPEAQFIYAYAPNTIKDSIGFKVEPSVVRALKVGGNLGSTDIDFLKIVREYANRPGEIGMTAREIVTSSGDYQGALQRLGDYNQGKLQGYDNLDFPGELGSALTSSQNLGKLMPLISAGISSADPQIRLLVSNAVTRNKSKGKELYGQLYPMAVKLLDDPDRRVQAAGMGCIFEMSGEINHRFGTREIDLPAYKIFLKNPDFYIAQYKVWWEKHKGSLK